MAVRVRCPQSFVPGWNPRVKTVRVSAVLALAALAGCAPHVAPLTGEPVPARFPDTSLGTSHRHVVFRWELDAGDVVARGQGSARIAPPDSVRLDFFLAGGMGSGAAVVIGDSLRLPPGGTADLLAPPALLWAALGRLAVPPERDTVVRRQGTTLEAYLGTPVRWRVVFSGDTLQRLERVDGGRVREWVARTADGHVHYRNERDRRTLDLVITTSNDTGPFDATLWSFP